MAILSTFCTSSPRKSHTECDHLDIVGDEVTPNFPDSRVLAWAIPGMPIEDQRLSIHSVVTAMFRGDRVCNINVGLERLEVLRKMDITVEEDEIND